MFVKFFDEISKGDVRSAGGKGASLGEMTKAGILVPPGFVVLSNAFEEFISSSLSSSSLSLLFLRKQESRQKKQKDPKSFGLLDPVSKHGMTLREVIDRILGSANTDDIKSVEKVSEEIRWLILNAPMPREIAEEIMRSYKTLMSPPEADQPSAEDRSDTSNRSDMPGYVAVRSSATAEDSSSAAWAGQLESYLNTTEETLLENVKKCWASLFTPRAIFYRFEKFPNSVIARQVGAAKPASTSSSLGGQSSNHKSKRENSDIGRSPHFVHDDNFISVAVVVQKMIQSEVSGVAFSVHPVTQDRNQMVIEAGFGLGDAIVSGQITPDNYIIQKNNKSKNQPRRETIGAPTEASEENKKSKKQKNNHNSSQPPLILRGGAKEIPSLRIREGEGELRILSKSISTQEKKLIRGKNGGTEWNPVAKSDQNKQKLSDLEILELSELIFKIEQHYGFPVDVEFARENGKFYIVQSRPITTL